MRTVQVEIGEIASRQFAKLSNTADGQHLARDIVNPDRQGCSPIAFTSQCPVLEFIQPVAKAPIADMPRNPVDGLVQLNHLIAFFGRGDEPRVAREIHQRCAIAPAVRIVMRVLA